MTKDDYTSLPGGSLKLKGVAASKISKSSKPKKKQKRAPTTNSDPPALAQALASEDDKDHHPQQDQQEKQDKLADEDARQGVGKTEAEKRHEERRRKRLDERLKREGVKTHKERVEELNRYLSNLSEHHDMPRIGPG